MVVILSSSRSRAYEFKRLALARLFGRECRDLTAEDLRFTEALIRAKCAVVDGAFVLAGLLQAWEEHKKEQIFEWLRYFLRAPLQPGEDVAEEVVDLLSSFAQSRESLSEDLLNTKDGIDRYPAEDRVLLHKTYVWVT